MARASSRAASICAGEFSRPKNCVVALPEIWLCRPFGACVAKTRPRPYLRACDASVIVLAVAGLLPTAGASVSFPKPAIAQGVRQLKLVTDWPESMPGLQTSAVRFAQTIGAATGGRIKIEGFPVNSFVRAFETFDAVSAGVADMYHSYDGYFEKKSRALNFYCGVPFGFTANELFAWVRYGGGQGLWDQLCGQFNIKPFLFLSTGTQMGGWFNNEIRSLESFKGRQVPDQEVAAAQLRAVEMGRDLIQAAPTGHSAFVDATGKRSHVSKLGAAQVAQTTLHKRTASTPFVRFGC